MFILIHGNPIDGFTHLGPFQDKDKERVVENATHAVGADWWIVPLENADPDGLDKYLMKHRG